MNRLHLAQPAKRDEKERPAHIPESALSKVKYDSSDPNRPKLMKDIEIENGGAGVFNVDLKENYVLAEQEWRYDHIPEIMDGKNVADFIDPEIEAKLQALEMEEEKLVQEGFYDEDLEEDESTKEENKAIRKASAIIKAKKEAMVQMHRISQGKNRPTLPRKGLVKRKTVDDLEEDLASRGRTMDTTSKKLLEARMAKKRGRSLSMKVQDQTMDVDMEDGSQKKKLRGVSSVKRSLSRSRSVVPQRDRSVLGLKSDKQKEFADKMKKKSQKSGNLMAKRGESDRQIQTKMPKHLFAGKRGFQADRR